MGAYDYITKPFDIAEVLLSVRHGLERRSLELENRRLVQHLTEMNQHLEEKVRERTAELELSKRKVEESAARVEAANETLRETNQQLEAAYAELKELDRLKSEFITIASHELRTPLVSIQGYTSITLQGRLGPLNERQQHGLRIAETNIHRLVGIVNDILDIARLDAHKMHLRPRPFSVPELLAQMAEEMSLLAEMRHQSLAVAPVQDAGACITLADRERVTQVLGNLISNAIRFTPDGGQLTLGCRCLPARDGVRAEIEVQVSDTGIGIEPQYHERIFEPFFEVQSSEYHSSGSIEFRSGGSGLGLSIVRGIVQQHGGRVWVESEPGKGSTFRFTLPAAEQDGKQGTADGEPAG
jgi:signal transduction histidine kinase